MTPRRVPWPRHRPPWHSTISEAVFPAGIPVLSRSGTIRGITMGRGGPCPSHSCDGYLVGVDWETGQMTHPCTKGWEAVIGSGPTHLRIIAGGEITGRVVNPTDPAPRDEWPERIDNSGIDWDAIVARPERGLLEPHADTTALYRPLVEIEGGAPNPLRRPARSGGGKRTLDGQTTLL